MSLCGKYGLANIDAHRQESLYLKMQCSAPENQLCMCFINVADRSGFNLYEFKVWEKGSKINGGGQRSSGNSLQSSGGMPPKMFSILSLLRVVLHSETVSGS